MHILAIQIELHLPGCTSLKEKRSKLKPLLARLHKNFNVSAAEIDGHDLHQATIVACVAVSNNKAHLERLLSRIPRWIEVHRPDLQVIDEALLYF